MNKVIDVLAKIAEDASLVNSEKLTTVITNADISTKQQQAFFAKDSQKLAETITNFPVSMCGVILTPQDTEEQENEEESKTKDVKNIGNLTVNAC
jgi:hypothetical protein